MPDWCNGSTADCQSVSGGSVPLFGESASMAEWSKATHL